MFAPNLIKGFLKQHVAITTHYSQFTFMIISKKHLPLHHNEKRKKSKLLWKKKICSRSKWLVSTNDGLHHGHLQAQSSH